jgi:uncharacterized membrane protein
MWQRINGYTRNVPVDDDELRRLQAEVQALHGLVSQLEERIGALETGRAKPIAASSQPGVESRFGLTVMNRVGALTLAIGIIFFFKYALDLSWIGPAAHVNLGILAGLLLLGASAWLNRREQKIFSQGIAGCGLATLYISVYAAFFYYQLIGQPAAFVALLCVCAGAIQLSLRYRTAAIAALGFLGGILTPVLLHGSGTDAWLDLPYLFLIDLTCVVIAMRQRWPLLIPLMGTAAMAFAWILVDARHPEWFAWFALAMTALHIGEAFRAERTGLVYDILYFTGHGCFALSVLSAMQIWTTHAISVADQGSVLSELGSFFLGVYGVAALIYGVARKSATNRTLGLVLLGLVIAKLYIWDVWFLERLYRMTAFIALGILLLGASYAYSLWRSKPE